MEVKTKISKEKRKRASIRQKKPIQYKPQFMEQYYEIYYKLLSNHDLCQWIDKLKIKHFRGIFCRDNLPKKMQGLKTGIINLDDSIGPGTHWVCFRDIDKQFCEYFDPFGLNTPMKIICKKVLKNMYSTDAIQEYYKLYLPLLA